MLNFLFKGKKKVAMRSQIVESFIGNLIKCESGEILDEHKTYWSKRSFNEVIKHFDENHPNKKFESLTSYVKNWVEDVDKPTFCDTYNVLHNIYFGVCATEYEKDKLRYEFKCELKAKGLKEAFEKHSDVKWQYYEGKKKKLHTNKKWCEALFLL